MTPFAVNVKKGDSGTDCSRASYAIVIINLLVTTNRNLPLFVSYAQIAIAKVPTTIRINPASAFLLNFSLNTK